MTTIDELRAKVLRDINTIEDDRKKYFYPVDQQTPERMKRYVSATKEQTKLLYVLEYIDNRGYAKDVRNGDIVVGDIS